MAAKPMEFREAMGHDTVIVGGGFAGIAAAVKLAQAGVKVALVEKRAFLGGRAYSIPHRQTGDWIDNGQHVVMGCYHEFFDLCRTLNTTHAVAMQPALEVCYRGPNGFEDILACPKLPGPWHLLLGLAGMRSLSWRDRWAALQFGLRLRLPGAVRPSETVRQFYQRSGQPDGLTKRLWDPIVISALNEKPEAADMRVFREVLRQAFFGRASGSRLGLPAAPLQALHGGSALRFIEERGGQVLLNQTVERLEVGHDSVKHIHLSKGEPLACRSCILAAPAPAAKKIAQASCLSERLNIPELGASPIVSVYLWFEQAFTTDTVVCLEGCRFEWIFFRSNFMRPGEHKTFCACLVLSAARDYWQTPRDQLIHWAVSDIHSIYKPIQQPTQAAVFWEPRATFSITPDHHALRPHPQTAIDNLFLAGDWTATGLPATIEGAVQSGRRAAALVLKQAGVQL